MKYNLKNLTKQYLLETPSYRAFLPKYRKYILNYDHIAFRSLSKDEILKESDNFKLQDTFFKFDKYNANAMWYKTNHKFKRIFMSYYKGTDTDSSLDKNEKDLVNEVLETKRNMFYEEYLKIHNKNQYLAWTLIHKDRINHIAIEVNDIENLTTRLINDGFEMNNVNGNVYSVGLNKKLIQTSIVADKIKYNFTDGVHLVPASFVEFVQRIDNIDGFDNFNANNVVLSTK